MTYLLNPPDITRNLYLATKGNETEQKAGTHYLLCKFEPMIHKLAFEICPKCDIKDMHQSGQLAILQAISDYNGTSQFSTWVFSKMRNEMQKQREINFPVKVSRYLMKKGCKATFEQVAEDKKYLDDPKDYLIAKEDQQQVAEALRHIQRQYSKRKCKIFVAYYFENIPLTKLTKKYKTNANAVVREMVLRLRTFK